MNMAASAVVRSRLPLSSKKSPASWLACETPETQQAFLNSLSDAALKELPYAWDEFWARPQQKEPEGTWFTWLIEAGRGFGKTKTGASWVCNKARLFPKCRILLGGATTDDYNKTMIEGVSGILSCSPPNFRPKHQASKRRLLWPNGSMAVCYSGETPDALRGPAHHFGWIDELCKFKYPKDFLDILLLGLRLGDDPKLVVTTTPKPIKQYLALRARENTVITGGSTYDNLEYLTPTFKEQVLSQYEGTRMGRQELMAELLLDVPGSLWKRDDLDLYRLDALPPIIRTLIAVDPAVSAEEDSDETGIVVVSADSRRHGYLQEDCSGKYTPGAWGEKVVKKY